ncbi:MAG: hypothetical protein ABI891_15455 [Acidobacteriota bacterium]
MKNFYTVFLIILIFALNNFAQVKKEDSNAALENAKIKITLLNLPGVDLEKSKWEMSYELRIATQKDLSDAMTNGSLTLNADQKLGDFVAKNSFSKSSLVKKENREIVLTIPLDKKIQEKLANDLASLVEFENLVAQNKNNRESLTERQIKSQDFVMYANILVYDAKLKKNIIVPFNWLLPYSRFAHLPGANFEMTFEIKEGGDFAKSVVLPERAKKSLTITTKQ